MFSENPVENINPIEPQPVACPGCSTISNPAMVFCSKCGYPVHGTQEQKGAFEVAYFKLSNEMEWAQRRIRTGYAILLSLAGFILLIGFSCLFAILELKSGRGEDFSQADLGPHAMTVLTVLTIVFISVGGVFLGLGLWAKKKPFTAMLVASIIFFTLTVAIQATINLEFFTLMIELVILIVLSIGSVNGYKAEQLKRKLNRE